MAHPGTQKPWIAVDWGTTRLRAWAMDSDRPLKQRMSDQGMAGLAPHAFEPALIALVDDWLASAGRTLVVACGMVGARQGWIEAPYVQVPCAPFAGDAFTAAPAADARLDVRIIPGLMQADPADVMRGEETQISGFLSRDPHFEGLLCLPGTHTKWAFVGGGHVTGFTTMMTGEIFALLAEQSVLRHSVGDGWDEAGFEQAVAAPAPAPGRLFELRAQSLLEGLAPGAARAMLSGRLIASELDAVEIVDCPVVVIGSDALAGHYARALELRGCSVSRLDGEEVVLAGLIQAKGAMAEVVR
ncbi:MAG: 2-dehydro-3-deoxygalactonokinase [Paracoccaceae bacterium]|nr:2-dehydro-3-deoxygalactonokinase [Paracoccaceae bacterium]